MEKIQLVGRDKHSIRFIFRSKTRAVLDGRNFHVALKMKKDCGTERCLYNLISLYENINALRFNFFLQSARIFQTT